MPRRCGAALLDLAAVAQRQQCGMAELSAAYRAVRQRPHATRGQVRGPLGVSWCLLREIEWTWPGAFVLCNARGIQGPLTKHSPAMLRLPLLQAWQNTIEFEAAAKLGPEFAGRRVFVGHARRCLG